MAVNRNLAAFAAINGATAVALGAFAAHGAGPQIKTLLTTGAQYQLTHALLAVACALWPGYPRLIHLVGWLASAGGLIFSLSLALLGLLSLPALGMVTPIGGVLMIVAWLLLVLAALRTPSSDA
jgi:uncharacterized membrane protein YgdD (TMEM256/DUF423 family)